MKLIVDLEKKSLKILENDRSIFRGEYGADKLELYINKTLENEYPTITALLSNGRKIGPYSTDSAYSRETIDGVAYTVASFTLSKENGFTLSEGKMMITIWMNSNGKKEAIGNVTLNVINTTAFNDGDIIISGDVEGTLVNYRVELENLQGQVNTFNGRLTNVETDTKNLTGKLKGFTDLGTFDLGFSVDSPTNELNSVQDSGMYFFRYKTGVGTFTCFMIVQYRSGTITQTIFERYDSESKTYKCTIRKSGIINWTISSFELTDKSYVVESIAKLVDDAPETFNTLNKLAQALKNKADTTYVDEKIANLVNSAPETLDTLGEIAKALEDNADIVETLNNAIGSKANQTQVDSLEEAYNELNTKVDNIKPEVGTTATEITYTELKALRDNGQLVVGNTYIITDYECTTTTANTKSAGHQFDIIVTAISENELSEVAKAKQHQGDTYFAENNLGAWELKYCLDNDKMRFDWADEVNGKGVIYWLKDEFDNEVAYDFKNIMYVKKQGFSYNQWGRDFSFGRNNALDTIINGTQYYGYTSAETPPAWSSGDCLLTDVTPTSSSTMYTLDGSQINYGGSITEIIEENQEWYTFGNKSKSDASLRCQDGGAMIIKSYIVYDYSIMTFIQKLNKNICISPLGGIYLDYNCYNNTLEGIQFIKFGAYCYENIINGGTNVSFGNACANNKFDKLERTYLGDSVGNCKTTDIFLTDCKFTNCNSIELTANLDELTRFEFRNVDSLIVNPFEVTVDGRILYNLTQGTTYVDKTNTGNIIAYGISDKYNTLIGLKTEDYGSTWTKVN